MVWVKPSTDDRLIFPVAPMLWVSAPLVPSPVMVSVLIARTRSRPPSALAASSTTWDVPDWAIEVRP
jgi:hypothetical protein